MAANQGKVRGMYFHHPLFITDRLFFLCVSVHADRHGDGTRGATAPYLERCALVEAPCQQLASLDGDRRQLQLALQNVPDGVDVGHIGLLFIVHRNLPIPGWWEQSSCIFFLMFFYFLLKWAQFC